MRRGSFKRAICFALALIFTIPAVAFADDTDDGLILTDPVLNTYIGRPQATRLIEQLQFTDLPANAAQRDAIIRSGALEVIRPAGRQFRPSAPVTREEAIAYSLRAAGLSDTALLMATAQAGDLPPNVPLGTAWALGYLQLASTIGMIAPADFDAALSEIIAEFTVLDAAENAVNGTTTPGITLADIGFQRTEPATREEVAFYIVTALQFVQADIFATPTAGVSLQSFSDWQSISAEMAPAVEALVRNNVMAGPGGGTFNPGGTITRAQMAQVIRNLDILHYNLHGFERVIGTIADITHEQYTETGAGILWRHIHVRRADGSVNILRHTVEGGPSPQSGPLDAVVLRGGVVTGLTSLQIGDQIEYIVQPETNTVWYVTTTGEATQPQTFRGRLEMIDMDRGTMTFRNIEGTVLTFPMSDGLHGIGPDGEPFIRFPANIIRPAAELPRGSFYDVTLVGNVITAIEFVGDPVLIPEHRGLVIENNPFLGYMTILDANRQEQSFTFNPGHLVVHRRQFFDARDTIGGLHEMFPGPRQHPRETDIANVIPGDIVVFRVCDDDPFRIIELSAAENTHTRYGRIREFRDQGGYFDMLMEFENGQTSWYTFVEGILILENGRPVSPNRIQLGDWARIVINQAILAPGVMMESVREVAIDGGGHHITSVVTGRLAGFNSAQNQLQIEHARELTPAGWSNHRPLASFNIGGPNVRYYHDGRRVTLEHLNRYLQRSGATVYMALENHHAGERAVVVSVRSGRDELIRTGTVLSSANDAFNLLEIDGMINTDPGTIVVRNGRLVEQHHIFAPDWARVAMNGPATAAVVDIGPAPSTSGVQIVRGRVAQVWPFESFRVETMSLFDGFNWRFTPIAREFVIDHDTIFINEGGVTSIDDFLGFTDASVIGDVFNVIVYGGRAVRVIDAPFTQPVPQIEGSPGHLTVRGIIYAIEGDTINLRDMTVYNPANGSWARFSNVDPTGMVTAHANTIVVDRNQVIPASRLQVGQQIMAFSPTPRDTVEFAPGLSADAFIILVES